MINLLILRAGIILAIIVEVRNGPSMAIPFHIEKFCKMNDNIEAGFRPGLYGGYQVTISKQLSALTDIRIKLDSSSAILIDNDVARLTAEKDSINNVFKFILLKDMKKIEFTVKGRYAPHHPPYITSIKIDGVEECQEPNQTFFGSIAYGVQTFFDAPDQFCGRRRIYRRYTELIVSGSPSKYGDWPWHSGIYRFDKSSLKYICGGTLISQFLVLTAAHCVTIRGEPVLPDILGVVLGKYSLHANDIATQSKEVFKVIAHDDYDKKTHANDIAMLKLRTQAIYNNFVQPACIWFEGINDQIGTKDVTGMVVGWGFDQNDKLTSELHEGLMPEVGDLTCIRYEPVFYSTMLDGKKFCAGDRNGTSACNGDSGGGFLVFVRDSKDSPIDPSNKNDQPGAWYIKGIVSTALARKDAAICDPKAYGVFTDVSKYTDFIHNQMSAK